MAGKTSFPRRELGWRLAAAAGGGYALCWALFAALCAWLPLPRAGTWYFTGLLAPLPFLYAILWAFAAATPRRALAWPLGLAALLAALALLPGAWR